MTHRKLTDHHSSVNAIVGDSLAVQAMPARSHLGADSTHGDETASFRIRDMPHVLFINRSYWPDTEATGQLLTDLSQDLTDSFDVTVLVGLPNHVEEKAAAPRPGADNHAGVSILRVWHSRFPKHNFVGRLLNLLTFSMLAFWRGLWLPVRPDVIVTESDPFFLPLVGRFLRLWYGCRFVVYLQDLYPDIAVAAGKIREGLVTRCLRSILVASYRRADRVVVLSRDMRRLCLRNGVPEEKLVIVPNWVDTTVIGPRSKVNAFRGTQQCDGNFVVMYSGNMGVGHLLEPLIAAAAQLRDSPEVLFLLIGEGQQKAGLQARVCELGLRNVRFLPYQPRSELAESLSAADLHVVSVRPEVAECLMPSKLYGVLAAGVPILALAPPECELAQLVTGHQLGTVCAPTPSSSTGEEIAEAIRQLLHDPTFRDAASQRARKLAESDYDRRHVTAQFRDLLVGVIGK